MPIRLRALDPTDIYSVSYGHIDNPALPAPADWREQRGTLFDTRIFGPERDWCCACGRYNGERHGGELCDICGVKIGVARELRRTRMGHIQLSRAVPHSMLLSETIEAIAVLPIGFRHDALRPDLDFLYARVLRANADPSADLETAVRALFDNESLKSPFRFEGAVAHSLAYHAFPSAGATADALAEPGASLDDLGIYLTALAIGIARCS